MLDLEEGRDPSPDETKDALIKGKKPKQLPLMTRDGQILTRNNNMKLPNGSILSIDFVLAHKENSVDEDNTLPCKASSYPPALISDGKVKYTDVREQFLKNLTKEPFGLEIYEYESENLYWIGEKKDEKKDDKKEKRPSDSQDKDGDKKKTKKREG